MAARLILAPETEEDLADACTWYESHRAGLGEEFLASVEACLERLRRTPQGFPLVHEHYRRVLLRRFPYAIFYEYVKGTATVYCVFHTSRDPHKWRLRLP